MGVESIFNLLLDLTVSRYNCPYQGFYQFSLEFPDSKKLENYLIPHLKQSFPTLSSEYFSQFTSNFYNPVFSAFANYTRVHRFGPISEEGKQEIRSSLLLNPELLKSFKEFNSLFTLEQVITQ